MRGSLREQCSLQCVPFFGKQTGKPLLDVVEALFLLLLTVSKLILQLDGMYVCMYGCMYDDKDDLDVCSTGMYVTQYAHYTV